MSQTESVHGCVFCGEPAQTQEHVIPKWLQKQFNLFDQHLGLWNGTSIPYRQAVVPACLRCNRDRFAPLEARIREGSASQRDYYLWALKITYGLGHRDGSLLFNRANPLAGPLLSNADVEDIGDFYKKAFQAVDSEEFIFSPDPFGSVLILESDSDEFALIDVPRPYRAVAVALPGRRHLVVLPADRGVIAKMYGQRGFKKLFQPRLPDVGEQFQLAVKVFLMLVTRCHLAIPREIYLEETGIFAAPVPRKLSTLSQPRELYYGIAEKLGLPVDIADAVYGWYRYSLANAEYLRWR